MPRLGKVAHLDLSRTSLANHWVKFTPCGWDSVMLVQMEPAVLFLSLTSAARLPISGLNLIPVAKADL